MQNNDPDFVIKLFKYFQTLLKIVYILYHIIKFKHVRLFFLEFIYFYFEISRD